MNRKIAFVPALCLVAGLCACGGPSDDEIRAVRNVSFEGTELAVALGANRSTGYEWDHEIYGECIEQSVGGSFKITGSLGDATGEEITRFEGVSAGTAVIVFTTPNGWDGTGEGDGYTVNVEVAADGMIVSANGSEGSNAPKPTPGPTPEPTPEQTPEPTPEPTLKTSVEIAELAEGTYTGTMTGDEFVNNSETVFTTIPPTEVIVAIEDGQLTLHCAAKCSAYGMYNGERTPEPPEFSFVLSGSLSLEQSGDEVTARGEVPILGEGIRLHYEDSKFSHWELVEREGDSTFDCTVRIAMENGVPVANITAKSNSTSRTATVPLALASGAEDAGGEEPLSAPYAEMFKSGDYQYTYPLIYEGEPYSATIATYDGMICRKVVSDDGTFSQRVVTVDGNAWKVDDLTGAVVDGGAENAETLPDYAGTLTFVASKALETGAIGDAYDFEYDGQKCNMVFLFTPEGRLVALYVTVGDETSEMEILNFSSVGNDLSLFDVSQ